MWCDAIGELAQPVLHENVSHWPGYNVSYDDEDQKLTAYKHDQLIRRGAQDLANSDFLGALLDRVGRQTKQTETGNQNGQ